MKPIYGMIQSPDGCKDEHGRFGWGAPDEEVHACIILRYAVRGRPKRAGRVRDSVRRRFDPDPDEQRALTS